jgi:hypothetical protein
MKGAIGLVVGAAVVVGFACGGNVVVDPTGDGGSGGAPPQTTTTTTDGPGGVGGAGAGCAVPAPIGEVIGCSGAATTGPGGPPQCDTFFCDAANNQFTVECSATTCVCLYNFQTLCSCANQGGGNICAGTAEPCCPFPFAQ